MTSYDYSRYSTTPSPPPSGSILYNLAYTDELLAIKVALRSQLKQNRLPNTPVGFPVFLRSTHSRYSYNNSGQERLDFQSQEFYQEVYTSDRRSKHVAKISFIAPHKSRTGMLQWTISVPARGSFGWQHDEDLSVIAHVQVDSKVLEDPNVGAQILANPRVVFEALADSLELGALITIAVATPTDNKGAHSRYGTPQIVLLSTDQYGHTKGQRRL
ncbi:hypothetical protein D9619_008202 [Psilocybe cf. subviscida]|uniref:Uncharacterized protein n=1 Tax=Psilocybe cf. subviscida TaxID=2480587 RepID=A0A8H5ASZ9_9AGAR|nr:hypothetical protein D9619_008202 [Psilocybe cf. subviscida]